MQHVRARKAFGGVGLFVKIWVYQVYSITENFKLYDDMLGVMFSHKATEYKFLVYNVYLPSEGSSFIAMPQNFSIDSF